MTSLEQNQEISSHFKTYQLLGEALESPASVDLFFKKAITALSDPTKGKILPGLLNTCNQLQAMLSSVKNYLEAKERAVGITEDGKHVILQQATRACVPATIAMLLLDRGGTPN